MKTAVMKKINSVKRRSLAARVAACEVDVIVLAVRMKVRVVECMNLTAKVDKVNVDEDEDVVDVVAVKIR